MHGTAANETAPLPLPADAREPWPSFLRTMGWVGLNSFGGPVAQLGVMHEEAVEKRRWLTDGQFVHLLNFANVLPGPEALEVAIHLGYLRRGAAGGVAAGLLFALPGVVSLSLLGWIYATWGHVPLVDAVLDGIRPVGMALIAAAAVRISAKALGSPVAYALCALSFALKLFLDVPFLALLAGCGVAGIALAPQLAARPTSTKQRAVFFASVGAAAALAWMFAPAPVEEARLGIEATRAGIAPLAEIAWVNTKAALVTFGGAYTVLPYLREQAVDLHRWVTDAQMIDALALAETTPGPLISVGVFLSYLAGGLAGALVGAFFLFLPSFVFVLGLGRHIHKVEALPRSREFLGGVSAGTLGLILAMAGTLAPRMVTGPFDAAVALAAVVAVARFKLNVVAAVGIGAALGVGRMVVGGEGGGGAAGRGRRAPHPAEGGPRSNRSSVAAALLIGQRAVRREGPDDRAPLARRLFVA